jgi:hypothetical protein
MTFIDALLLTAIATLITLTAVAFFEAGLLLAKMLMKRFRRPTTGAHTVLEQAPETG